MIEVRPCITWRMLLCSVASVSGSMLAVASSMTRTICGLKAATRAQRDELLLAGREVGAALGQQRVVALGHALDEGVGADQLAPPRAPAPAVIECVAHADVLRRRVSVKMKGSCSTRPTCAAQLPLPQRRDRHAVDQDLAALHVVEAVEQAHHASTCRRRSRRRWRPSRRAAMSKRDVAQHPVLARRRRTRRRRNSILPSMSRQGRAAPSTSVTSSGSSRTPKMRSHDAIACCRVVKRSDRSRIGQKKRCMYWRNATSVPRVSVVDHAAAAVPDDQRRGDGVEQHDRRLEDGVVEDDAQVGAQQAPVALVEAARFASGG